MTEPIHIQMMRLPHGANLPLPAYATAGAAGMDVVAAEALTLAPGARAAVATGFAVAIPAGYEVQVRPRSGLALKHGVTCLNTPGTIDSDYRGEVKVILANLGDAPFEIARGDRIAQLVPAPVQRAILIEISELDETARGGGRVRLDRSLMLSDAELDRYARHIVLKEIGGAGQACLRAARIAVIGAGGIGSPALQYLAAAGIGRLTVIDDDAVDLSNLQRQTLFGTRDVGTTKVVAAAQALARINPEVPVEMRHSQIDASNAAELLAGANAVLDGSDNFTTRLAVADAALALRIPLVSAAVAQFEGQLAVYRGWEADKPCYRCFVGADPDRAEQSCAEAGVLGAMAGVIGSLAALECIRAVVPFGEDSAGKLLLADALSLRFRTLALPKDPGCPACAG